MTWPPAVIRLRLAGTEVVFARTRALAREHAEPTRVVFTAPELAQLAVDSSGQPLSAERARALVCIKEVFPDALIIDGPADRAEAAEMRARADAEEAHEAAQRQANRPWRGGSRGRVA